MVLGFVGGGGCLGGNAGNSRSWSRINSAGGRRLVHAFGLMLLELMVLASKLWSEGALNRFRDAYLLEVSVFMEFFDERPEALDVVEWRGLRS